MNKKCFACLVHQREETRFFLLRWENCFADVSIHKLFVGKDEVDALSKAFSREEYDEYVVEMEENRKLDPSYGETQAWEEWLKSQVADSNVEFNEIKKEDVIL